MMTRRVALAVGVAFLGAALMLGFLLTSGTTDAQDVRGKVHINQADSERFQTTIVLAEVGGRREELVRWVDRELGVVCYELNTTVCFRDNLER